jgi:peptide/nickel transport system substrate-binding protein
MSWMALAAFGLGAGAVPAMAQEVPRQGGELVFVVPAEPPSYDAHREETFAVVHPAAPHYNTLLRVDPFDKSGTRIVGDLAEAWSVSKDGRIYTFTLRRGVRFHDGSELSARDVKATYDKIIFPPAGVVSARQASYTAVERIDAPDAGTVVFHLKYPQAGMLANLASPWNYLYKADILEQDPRWYEKNIMGTGPFKFVHYETGQSMKGERNPDYYEKGLPYLDGFIAIFADKQATRVDAIRADRAAMEFRGMPPSARDELVGALGDKITVQEGDWDVASAVTPNHKKKPFDDARVRRALTLAIDRWHGAPALSKVAIVNTVGGIAFPGAQLAATKEELEKIAGFWPDIEKSRAEAKRLLKEAGAEGLTFELLNRNVDQPYKYNGTWVIDEWSKIGLKVTQKMAPTGPWFEALRAGNFDVGVSGNCQSDVNPLLDVQRYLPGSVNPANYGNFEDPASVALYDRMLRETHLEKQRALMREFEKHVLDTEAHDIFLLWWYRTVPHRSYVKGWKISPSHFINQDLATIWLDR